MPEAGAVARDVEHVLDGEGEAGQRTVRRSVQGYVVLLAEGAQRIVGTRGVGGRGVGGAGHWDSSRSGEMVSGRTIQLGWFPLEGEAPPFEPQQRLRELGYRAGPVEAVQHHKVG